MAVHLIRFRPDTSKGDCALVRAGQMAGCLCFFHGDGIQHALDPAASRAWAEAAAVGRLELVVCETALARRSKDPLESPWRSGSLVQFWQALLGSVARMGAARPESGVCPDIAPDSVSLHRGYDIAPSAAGGQEGRDVLIRIDRCGDELYDREVLELCLAGAALEADMAICFFDSGVELMRGPGAASWRQFPDFELAPLYYVADRKAAPDVSAQRLNKIEAAQMIERANRVINV